MRSKNRELVNGHREVTRPSIDSSAGRASHADEEESQCLISPSIRVPALGRAIV